MKNIYVIEYGHKFMSWSIVECTPVEYKQWHKEGFKYKGYSIHGHKKVKNIIIAKSFITELYRYQELGDLRRLKTGISPLTAKEHIILMRDCVPTKQSTYIADIDYSTDDIYISRTINNKPKPIDLDNLPF